MEKGTQIAYIPSHAQGDINHSDVEFGFVTSEHTDKKSHFCRYWSKIYLGKLRTMANSENTLNENLIEIKTVDQLKVNNYLKLIEEGKI